MNGNRSIWIGWIAGIVLFGSMSGCGNNESSVKPTEEPAISSRTSAPVHENKDESVIVATVNGRPITRARLLAVSRRKEEMMVPVPGLSLQDQIFRLRYQELDRLVTELALSMEAAARGLQISDEDIDIWLKSNNMYDVDPKALSPLFPDLMGVETREQYREVIRANLSIQRMQEQIAQTSKPVTEEDIRSYYEKNKDKFRTPSVVHAYVIVIRKEGRTAQEARERADSILQDLRMEMQGARQWEDRISLFANYARKFSEHPSGQQGGWWVVYNRGGLGDVSGEDYTQFEEVAYSMPLRTLGDVEEMPHGYFICMVDRREEQRLLDYDSQADAIRRILVKQRFEEIHEEFYADLKTRYEIRIFRENIMPETGA